MSQRKTLELFGDSRRFNADDWSASDDRVRGGSSHSYFETLNNGRKGRFYGTLDIKTLGGAGFASRRTMLDEDLTDLSSYDGLQLNVTQSDKMEYTFILKDSLNRKNPDSGREEAVVSWEYDCKIMDPSVDAKEGIVISLAFADFKPTYRGKEQKDVKPLKTAELKSFSIMCRSFFAKQEGDFSLTLDSVAAFKHEDDKDEKQMTYDPTPYRDDPSGSSDEHDMTAKPTKKASLLSSVCCCLL